MTDRQRKFADEYIIDCNATRAYKAAYPNVKKDATAGQAGSRLLKNVNVKAYIAERLEAISNNKTAEAREVMEYLTSVLRGESESEVIVIEGAGDGYSEAKRICKRPDEKERLRAAELLGKRFGLYNEKVKLEGEAKVVIVDDLEE